MPSSRRLLAAPAAVAGLACALSGLAPLPAAAAPPAQPFLSEVHYDNAGTDTGEFVEVHLPPGTSSEGLAVALYDGSTGAQYDLDPLPLVTAPADAPAVAVVGYPANGVQNGAPDGVALVRGTTVLELLSYEGAFAVTSGVADGLTTTGMGVQESSSTPAGHSLSRRYDAAGDALVWSPAGPASRGAVNGSTATPPAPQPATPCADTAPRPVGVVQGSGATTPLAGQAVTVRGRVVGDVPGLSGFYLQDAGDGDPATSDGVFVFSRVPVDLGDEVAATGPVAEFPADPASAQTQVAAGSAVEVCADGSAADLPDPAPLDLPADSAERERLEGMLVEPVDALTVSEVYDLTRFGELTVAAGGVLVQPTEVARPGTSEAAAVAEQNALRSLVLDDGLSSRVSATTRPYLAEAPVRVGDVLELGEPLVLGQGFGAYRLQPADGTADGVLVPRDTRPAAPEPVGGDVQVAAFNVLNYFLQPRDVPTRGARSEAEFLEQAAKTVAAITALGADVVTLMEIEDTDASGLTPGDADTALRDLVARLNTAAGAPVWAHAPLPQELYAVDRDVIRNAIIYRQDVVQPVGDPVGLVDESVWSNAREPQAQAFVEDGDVFTVVANHFKSKSPGNPAPAPGTPNADTGQGAFNADRVRQAVSLAQFAEQLAAVDPDVLLLGDLNAYTQEDPVEVLREAGFTDLGALFDPGRYSYVFDALSGSLDHALGTGAVTAKVTGVAHWSINSVESFAYQYNGDPALYAADPYRSSDHDPVLLGLDLVETCAGLTPTLVGTDGDDVLQGTNGRDVVLGLGGDDRLEGGNGEDVLCGGAGDDVLVGGNGDDRLLGGLGDDVLLGENGADALVGGPGRDDLQQGRGEGPATQDGAAS